MSFPRHLRKKRPKPRPNSRPGRLDLTSVKLRSSALGRCHKANWNRTLITCHQGIKVDTIGVIYAKQTHSVWSSTGDRRAGHAAPDLRIVQVLWKSQVIRAGERVTVRNDARFSPD